MHLALLPESALGKAVPEKLGHPIQRQPHRLTGEPHVQGGLAVLGPIQDYFTAIPSLCPCHHPLPHRLLLAAAITLSSRCMKFRFALWRGRAPAGPPGGLVFLVSCGPTSRI